MATAGGNIIGITELSQLVSTRQPLENLIPERNQEDNFNVFEYVNSFLDVLDRELNTPKSNKLYRYGQKESFIRSGMMPRIELVASRIIEKKALACSTLSLEELEFFQQEIDLFTDLYFLLVTTLIDLTSIRKTDLDPSGSISELFSAIKENLIVLGNYDEMKQLNDELDARKEQYPGKPELEKMIRELIQVYPVTREDFKFSPVKSISDYVAGDILVSLQPDSNILSLAIGVLPNGVELNQETGDILIVDPNVIEAGDYDVILTTSDEFGGTSTIHLELPIGVNDIPRYELAPKKVLQAYSQGDVLARPTVNEYVPVIARAEWAETAIYPVPTGVGLNANTGVVTVIDEDVLMVGIYPVRIIITAQNGSKSRHEFTLNFKQDSKAVYSTNPRKSLAEYKSGDLLASVIDIDGKIIGVQGNAVPFGTVFNAAGQLIVDKPEKLVAGTHLFNVIATDSFGVEVMKTLFLTFDPRYNPFSYDVLDIAPIDDLAAGTLVATLVGPSDTPVEKVTVINGVLPSGLSIASNGNVSVIDPSKLQSGNFDIRVHVYVNGIDPILLNNKQTEIDELNENINLRELDLEADSNQIKSLEHNLNLYKTTHGFLVQQLNEVIAGIELALITATSSTEQDELNNQLQIKQQELAQLISTGESEIENQNTAILALKGTIDLINQELVVLNSELISSNRELLKLKSNRWIEYDVPLLITLEEDNPSAWHVEIPKDWDEYTDNEVIAQLIDCDGFASVRLEPITQTMPSGLSLNTTMGIVEVTDHNLLQPGEYVVTTRSRDKQDGITDHRLAIIIGGDSGGQAEDYILLPTKPANNYVADEILGYPYNKSYSILSARLSQGLLPKGVALDPETGAIFVEDPAELKSGVFDGIVIKTNNSSGGVYYHNIAISFVLSTVFDVTVALPKPMSAYNDGEAIVTVSVNQGILQGVQLVSGQLAPGTALHSFSGKIFVLKSSELVAGDYQVELFMAETNGATDQQTVDFTIGSGVKASVNWDLMNPIDKSSVTTNTAVATPSILNRSIVAATLNPVPRGILPIAPNGEIRVGSPADIDTGTDISFNVELTDNFGEVYQEQFTIPVLQSLTNSAVISAIVTPSRDFHMIKNGDILSKLHPEAAVSNVSLAGGIIPEASFLTIENGRIVVIDRYKLGRGITTANLAVQVLSSNSKTLIPGFSTKTLSGATTTSNTLNAVAGDIQIVDVTIENKAIPNFADVLSTEAFLGEMVVRVEDFQKVYLSDSTAPAVLFPLDAEVMSMATWLLGVLKNPDSRNTLRSGGLDSSMLQAYQTLSDTFMVEFTKQTDPLLRELIADLYNEMYTTQLAIFIFRDKDITSDLKHPVTRIIDAMAKNLPVIRDGGIDIHYMVNNALIISEFIDPKNFPILKSRFSMLAI